MTRSLRPAVLAALLCFSVLISPAAAQLAGPFSGQRGTRDMLADQLFLLMQESLAGQGMPTDDQYARAGVLLDLALGLSPQNAEFWRTKAELAQVRGRGDERRQALTQYLKLEPTDDAAQLELILGRVSGAQTLDDRLRMLERVLDAESSRSLSAPLRSRLASMAATAAKEIGDRDRHVQRLKQAISLDAANGEAARMLYDLSLQESQSSLHRGAAAIAWVRGEPANASARFTLAHLLLKESVYHEAAQQFSMAAGLSDAATDPELLRLWTLSIAGSGEPDQALGLLRQVESMPTEEGRPSGLAFDLALLRLAVLTTSQRRDEAQAAWTGIVESLKPNLEAGDAAVQSELAVASAVFAQDAAGAEARLPADAPDSVSRLVRGWVAVHGGEAERAREQLRPIAEGNPLAALGLAAIESDEAARLSMLDAIRRRDPDGVSGLLAVMETRRLRGEVQPTREGQSLRDFINRSNLRVWYTDLSWSPWLSMRLEIDPPRLQYLSPVTGVASFRNLTGVPVSLGTGATVPTRMIVSITPSKYGQLMQPLTPMVVDVGRSLTIPEGGSLRVPFRLDYSSLGELLGKNPSEPIDLQVTAVLDPRPAANGGVRPGPVGAMDTNRATQASPRPITPETAEEWIAALDGPDAVERFRAIARLLDAVEGDGLDDVVRARIGGVLGTRFPRAEPVEQAWTLRFLPAADGLPQGLRDIGSHAQRSADPLVRITHLATAVRTAADPALAAALREEDPTIAEFARALQTSQRETAAQP